MEPHVLENILDGRGKPTNLQLGLLKSITDNFSEEREIGHGGFAKVYKGVLPKGSLAVKRIRNNHTIDEKLFYREVNSLLTISHPNIVRFLGFCASTDQTAIKLEGKREHVYAEIRERLLCFEYISNGNLQKHITDELRGLDWSTRFDIIKGICDGLHYLHMERHIYHMDLKPANILLNNDMVPKITDFGLSRLDDKSQTMTADRHGSLGYCAPEYIHHGKMSSKSDIYSLGTIITELVTGEKSIPDNNKNNVLRRWRHRLRKAGNESPLVYQQVAKCIDIGLQCQEIDPCTRPFISDIVRDINEMDVTNSQASNDNESTGCQINSYLEDDMLGIEPLELHFPFEINKKMACSLQLTNRTDSNIAFEVQKMSPLPYCTKPHQGIVPPRSECGLDITLEPQEKAPQRANEFIVRSTKVKYGFTPEDITTSMFSRDIVNVVDEVNLEVVFDQRLQTGSRGIVQKGSQYYGNTEDKPMAYEGGPNFSLEKIPSSNMQEAHDWMTNSPLVGREPEMNELRGYTARVRFNNSPVLSVWGIAGIGKSALVRNLFYNRMLKSYQFNKYCWVDVTHPFSLSDFSRSLISDHHSEKDPIKECQELLSRYQCLVVIDDIQSKEEWDLIQAALVSRYSSSVIIVITTEASIATYCTNHEGEVFNVKGLEDADAMDLFRKEVYRINPSAPLNDYQNMELKEVILKCGGLPVVILCIAGLVATETATLMDTINSLNHKFMYHLETNKEYESLRGLFDWMLSYFNTCPSSLKACTLYLSIFPPYYNIRGRRLVWRWIAEGYIRDSDEESAVGKGENFLSKIHSMNIIQQKSSLVATACNDTRLASCQVNGFFHEYILSGVKEENHVFILGPNGIPTTEHVGHHLVILGSWKRDSIGFESMDFSWLRSLTVFGNWESFFISTSMMLLLVLDLEDVLGVKDDDLEKIVKLLRGLKFLSLRGCIDISRLPSSLGNLMQLQTLDVRHTSIVTLPPSVTKLQKLQYIRAGTTIPASTPPASSSWLPKFLGRHGKIGFKVPRGFGKLTALHTLGVINLGASGWKAILEELKTLTQLRKLGVSGINKHNSMEFLSATSGHVHLESLLVQLDEDSQGCLDDISLPLENLQSLKLYGLQDKLPLAWNPDSKLRKLDLEMDTLQKYGMEVLASLPELCILRLRVKQLEDGKLHFQIQLEGLDLDAFKKVKILEVTCRSSRLHVTFGSRSMQNLELLTIDCSTALYQLTGLDNLSELKELTLNGTNDEAIKTSLEYQLLSHPKAPTVKLAELPRS